MKKISTTRAFADLVLATNAGKIKWPLTKEQRAQLAADAAEPPSGDAYGRLLASGNDWLSRFRREHEKE